MLVFNESDFGLLDLTAFSESTIVATSPSIRYNLGDVATASTTRPSTASSAVGASVAMGLGALGMKLGGQGGGAATTTTTRTTTTAVTTTAAAMATIGVNHVTDTTTKTTTLAAAVAATVATTRTTASTSTTAVATTTTAAAEIPVVDDLYSGLNEDISLSDELLAPFLDLSNITSDLGYSEYDVLNGRGWKAAIVMIYVLVIAVGVVGNLLTVYVILRNKHLHGVTNVFIVTLALSDVVLCVFNLPFQLHYQLTDNWFFGKWLCHVIVPTFAVPLHVSTASILAISVNRYLLLLLPPPPATSALGRSPQPTLSLTFGRCHFSGLGSGSSGCGNKSGGGGVCSSGDGGDGGGGGGGGGCSSSTVVSSSLLHPSSSSSSPSSSLFSRHRTALLIVAAILVFSFVPAIPLIVFANLYAIPDASANTHFVYCGEAWPSVMLRRIYRAGMFIVQFCIPLLASAAIHLRIYVVLEQCTFKKHSERRQRTDRALAAILLIFTVCWFPWNTFVLLGEFDYEVVRGKYFTLTDLLLKIFAISSACVKPVLYAWLNGNFRKELSFLFNRSPLLGCSNICKGSSYKTDECHPTKEGHTLLEPNPSSTTRASMMITENTTTDFC